MNVRRVGTFLMVITLIAATVGCVGVTMFDIDPNSGKMLDTAILTSSDEMLTVTIPEGTIALDREGNPLLTLEVDEDPEPAAPPEDAHIVGLAYNLGPAGATFDPAMSLTWKYNPADIPTGVNEENLVIAYHDEATGEWVICESVVDTTTNTVTASVFHLTTFAIVGVPSLQYTLSISSTAGGNVTTPGEGTFTYDEGTVVSLVAQPDEGYQFVNWSGDVGTVASANTTSTTIVVEGNYSITASFKEIPPVEYDLTISSTAGGLVTVPGEGTFTYNASTVIDLVANPLSGYYFVNWTGNVSTVANVNAAATTITMNGTYSIMANFYEIPVTYYTLTVGINGSGSTSPSVGQHTYAAGTVVSISTTPTDCYRFVNWTGNVGTIANVNAASTTIRMNGHYSITANLQQEEPVYFADSNLETAIRWPAHINKPEGPICPSDLEGLTCLWADHMNISDLTGLEHCTSLTELHLSYNQIADLSLLANLTGPTELYLRDNHISDISPLANLTNLTNLGTLDLRDNQIDDISAVSGLTSLTWLILSNNQISDISPVSSLINLRGLLFENNQIGDISSLANLTNLIRVDMPSNQVSDISPLANLGSLVLLDASGNQISDISPLTNLTNLTDLRLHDNQISDISPLANLTKMIYLQLDDNQISDVSPLVNFTDLDQLRVRSNQLSDISPLANLTALTTLWLDDNHISDISSLVNLTNLRGLWLPGNQISDVSPLVENEGLSERDEVNLTGNPLSSDSINIYIPQLEARGVIVDY
ncbi:MAG: leucine-rich repeat domain-containing protein [Dehalococcoidia bacterium]